MMVYLISALNGTHLILHCDGLENRMGEMYLFRKIWFKRMALSVFDFSDLTDVSVRMSFSCQHAYSLSALS